MQAVANIATNKLMLHFDDKPAQDVRERLKALRFAFWPGRVCWAAAWSPAGEDLARELGFPAIEYVVEPDDAEARAARFAAHADKHATHADTISAEARAEDYWRARARAALWQAKHRESVGTIYRRIEGLEADRRKAERYLDRRNWEAVEHGPEWAQGKGEDPEQVWATRVRWAQRLIDWYDKRLAYERELYEQSGGLASERLEFHVGGAIGTRFGFYEVKRVNRKSITVVGWLDVEGMEYKLTPDEIYASRPPEWWQAARAKATSLREAAQIAKETYLAELAATKAAQENAPSGAPEAEPEDGQLEPATV